MIIFDEIEEAEKLDNHVLDKNNKKDKSKIYSIRELILLARYYDYLGFSGVDIKSKLYKKLNGVNLNKMSVALEEYDKRKINLPNKIFIYESEMEKIQKELNYNYQKLLFVMLAILKFYTHDEKSEICMKYNTNTSFAKLIKLGQCKFSREEKKWIVKYLGDNGYIEMDMLQRVKLLYHNPTGKVVLSFIPTEDLVLEYEMYIGKKIIRCQRCGKLIRKKSNSHKYCDSCAEIIHREQNSKQCGDINDFSILQIEKPK